MNSSRLRQQLAWPLLAALVFALAHYLLYQLSPSPVSENVLTEPKDGYGWILKLAAMAFALSVALAVVRLAGALVFYVFRRRKGYEAPSLMRDIFALVAYVALLVVVLRYFFPDLSFGALISGSALLGVILGLALQDTLGNLFAGISLHADKPFQVGDVIAVGDFTGVVESVTWRAVKIRTFQNHVVLLSNSSIAKESIEVCPRDNANARLIFFDAVETDSPARVIEVAREAVRECENVLRYMTPIVRVRKFSEAGIEYEAKYWLEDYAKYNDTDALVRQRIWYAFRRHGLSFGFPTRTLEVASFPTPAQAEQAPQLRQQEQRDNFARRLSGVVIFSPLSEEQMARLAGGAESYLYAPGETIIRAGESGSSMFVVERGSVEVQVSDKGRRRVVNTLDEGDFFGEMALFTGEARTADVVAVEETEVIEIKHRAMKRLFDTNPELVESLSQTIGERRLGLRSQGESFEAQTETTRSLITSVKRFFGIK